MEKHNKIEVEFDANEHGQVVKTTYAMSHSGRIVFDTEVIADFRELCSNLSTAVHAANEFCKIKSHEISQPSYAAAA